MGYRNRGTADRARIDALEDELEAKDDRIARLERELAAAKNPPKVEPRPAQVRPPTDALAIPTPSPGTGGVVELVIEPGSPRWAGVFLVGGAALAGLLYAVVGLNGSVLVVPVIAAMLCALVALYRTRILVDGNAGTITREDWLLIPRKRHHVVNRRALVVVEFFRTPEKAPSWWEGKVQLGGETIWSAKKDDALEQAQKAGACLGVPVSSRAASTLDREKDGTEHNWVAAGLVLVALLVGIAIALVNF